MGLGVWGFDGLMGAEITAVLLRRDQRERDSKHMELWLMRYWAIGLRVGGFKGLRVCWVPQWFGSRKQLATDLHRFTRIVFYGVYGPVGLCEASAEAISIFWSWVLWVCWFDGGRVFMPLMTTNLHRFVNLKGSVFSSTVFANEPAL